MGKNPEMPKGMAYAVATQQAHKVGKSPKGFRTKAGVRRAKAKHYFPKKMYKKTAAQKLAFDRLKKLQKLAAPEPPRTKKSAPRTAKFRSGTPDFKMPPKKKTIIEVPRGMKAKKRGWLERKLLGPKASQFKIVKAAPAAMPAAAAATGDAATKAKVIESIGAPLAEGLAERIRTWGTAPKAAPAIPAGAVATSAPKAAKSTAGMVRPMSGAKFLSNPAMKKALKYTGLGALGVGLGAAGHQMAHSVGLTESGPADVLANIVVPGVKTGQDHRAIAQERNMYIPRFYLEKAAAAMAGALEDNEGTMHEGEPGMHGPEASVIPQQTLETVVPITQHVDKADKDADDFIHRMFAHYKSTKEESVGRYTKGETEIPLNKQAGRLAID